MEKKLSILGLGFSGLDIINTAIPQYMPGGTCANVLTVLSHLGWAADLVKAEYSDSWNDFVDTKLSEIGVNIKVFRTVKEQTPRVVQVTDANGHRFFTRCPNCGQNLITLKLPASAKGVISKENIFPYDIVYFDRVSPGINQIVNMAHKANAWTFYEPNSARSYTQLLKSASQVDIIKFSQDRISMTTANKLVADLSDHSSRTKLVLCSGGNMGIYYAIRNATGGFSQMTNTESLISGVIVDSSGAGDWLTAGLIDHLVQTYRHPVLLANEELSTALTAGQEQAKVCCNYMGALGYFFSKQEKPLNTFEDCCEFCKMGKI